MSAPVYRDDNLNDARLYAPPWARERPLPAAGQPQFTSSPPVASADDPTEESAPPKEPPRMPRGAGGQRTTRCHSAFHSRTRPVGKQSSSAALKTAPA